MQYWWCLCLFSHSHIILWFQDILNKKNVLCNKGRLFYLHFYLWHSHFARNFIQHTSIFITWCNIVKYYVLQRNLHRTVININNSRLINWIIIKRMEYYVLVLLSPSKILNKLVWDYFELIGLGQFWTNWVGAIFE